MVNCTKIWDQFCASCLLTFGSKKCVIISFLKSGSFAIEKEPPERLPVWLTSGGDRLTGVAPAQTAVPHSVQLISGGAQLLEGGVGAVVPDPLVSQVVNEDVSADTLGQAVNLHFVDLSFISVSIL